MTTPELYSNKISSVEKRESSVVGTRVSSPASNDSSTQVSISANPMSVALTSNAGGDTRVPDVVDTRVSTNPLDVALMSNAGEDTRVPNMADTRVPDYAPSEKMAPIKDHYRGYLPHIENKRFQVITFRLYDSVPKEIIEQWKRQLEIEKNKKTDDIKYSQLRELIDYYEDAGYGQCFLKDERIAKIVEDALYFYDKQHYNLIRYCIMPNHVHVLIEVLESWSLSTIMKDWKAFTARMYNKILGRKGDFWMLEYFDRYIRNQEHFKRAFNYIDNNPVKANLVEDISHWRWCSLGRLAFEAVNKEDSSTHVSISTNTLDVALASNAGEDTRAPGIADPRVPNRS